MAKIIFKKMNVYRLHRSNEIDHQNGRPAILLKYKQAKCLVWTSTSKVDQFTQEKPVLIKINDKNNYFYSTGIEKVETTDLKGYWTNFQTYDVYLLSSNDEKQLITKFISLTNEKDPYEKIALLELENKLLKKENEQLRQNQQELESQLESENELQ